ncbi:MAG TPA: hypothetical protein VNA16_02775 [Abditibacteriaceae bacterium]|nr:hypothetical protein [Abditibacteriaceae bacterium]
MLPPSPEAGRGRQYSKILKESVILSAAKDLVRRSTHILAGTRCFAPVNMT